MALNIKNGEVDRLARRSAELRETSITEAVHAALQRDVVELEQERERRLEQAMDYLKALQARMAAMPDRDARPAREIQNELNRDVLDSHR